MTESTTNESFTTLIVDDDHLMVKTICDILTIKGYEAIKAYSGEDAVEIVTDKKPDCIFMDIKMPGIDGVEAMTIIKNMSPQIPIVLMSANVSEDKMCEARLKGANMVIMKPVDIETLLSYLNLLKNGPTLK